MNQINSHKLHCASIYSTFPLYERLNDAPKLRIIGGAGLGVSEENALKPISTVVLPDSRTSLIKFYY